MVCYRYKIKSVETASKPFWVAIFILCVSLLAPAWVQSEEESIGAPIIGHSPVATAVRGVPINISATIAAQGIATITSKVVEVKLSDVGNPVDYPLTGVGAVGSGAYNAVLPISLFKGVSVFWYSITAYDSNGQVKSTPWMRVTIVEVAQSSSGEAQVSVSGGSGGGSGGGTDAAGGGAAVAGGGGVESTTFIIGGLLLAGGAAAIIEDQSGGSSNPPEEPEEEEPEEKKKKPTGGTNETAPVDPDQPCVTTGSEAVSYENLSLYCDYQQIPQDIEILVCGACPDATIMAMSSWGESDTISLYNNDSCDPGGAKLFLPPPLDQKVFYNPGDETITVYANGVEIDQQEWPPLSDNNCL